MKNRISLILVLFTMLSLNSYSQEESCSLCNIETDFGLDLMSRYVWRGLDYGTGASFQPYTDTKIGIFNLSSWGAFSSAGDYSEVVLMAGITLGEFKFQINDTYVHRENMKNTKYFNYDKNTTTHMFSANLFVGGSQNIPVKLMVSTYFHGAGDQDHNQDKRYSTYIKVSYPFKYKDMEYEIHLAGTPNSKSVYQYHAGIMDTGISIKKKIKITDNYSLPVSASFIANPYYENFYMVFGIHL